MIKSIFIKIGVALALLSWSVPGLANGYENLHQAYHFQVADRPPLASLCAISLQNRELNCGGLGGAWGSLLVQRDFSDAEYQASFQVARRCDADNDRVAAYCSFEDVKASAPHDSDCVIDCESSQEGLAFAVDRALLTLVRHDRVGAIQAIGLVSRMLHEQSAHCEADQD